ncbi:MAG: cobalamin-binding protein [Firmicutes bacterium]|nr:cobalamin-binding protein [Bacillota bacterium]
MANLEKIKNSVIEGDVAGTTAETKSCLESGMDPMEIINQGLVAGMNVVGPRFKAGDMFVPEVLMSARAMHAGLDLVKEKMVDFEMPSSGKVIIGTVKGDLHDIGKNLVAIMLESSGFTVVNLGVDIPPEKFAEAVKEHEPQVVGLSALLTTTMLEMKETIDYLKEEGLRDKVKVVIGGAPVTDDFSTEIGADGYAPDGGSAVELVQRLIG